jgi:hypothetical protein
VACGTLLRGSAAASRVVADEVMCRLRSIVGL